MRSFIRVFFLLTGIFVISGFGQTTNLPKGIIKIDSIEGINEYRLENGLQILLIPDSSRQNITVNIIYRVGSRHESYGETGMAHLLEHLVFRGTPKHPDIPAELTARGASPNGTTWYDRTNYYESFVATDDNLDWALDLEADRMINSFISKKDLDKEFSVVRNELESGENSPGRVLNDKVMATAYQWHNYGKTTIGARSDVEKVKIENLQAFYRKYYQPDNATLVLGGKFDEAKALDLISKKFGAIPKPTRVLENTWTVEPVQDGERQVIIRRVGDTQLLTAGYHVAPASHPDYAALRILLPIITDSTNGKLYKALVDTKKATSVSTNMFQNKEPSYATFDVQLAKDANIEEAREILVKTVENFAAEPPTAAEVERMKTGILTSIERGSTNAENVAMSMTGWVAAGDWRLSFLYRDRIKKVTPADVQRVAKTYFLPSNRTVGMFIPTQNPVRASVPRVEDNEILAMAKGIERGKELSVGELFDPTPANILKRTNTGQISGIKTAYLSKENRGDKNELKKFDSKISAIKTLKYQSVVKERLAELLKFGKGDIAIDFAAVDTKGNPVNLTSLKGKVIYIDLWATWCGPCYFEMPFFEKLKEKYKGNENIAFVSLSIDDEIDLWKKDVDKRKADGIQWLINRNSLLDYNIVGVPRTIVIDKSFKIADLNAPFPSSKDTEKIIEGLLK